MRHSKVELAAHFVWATQDREPLVTPDIERAVHRGIAADAERLGCTVHAVGGMPDHVHCVLSCPSTVTIATVARQLKGVSSALANSLRGERGCFRWQTGYGAFTIGRTQVPATVAYVRGQCQHHAVSSLHADWEPDAAVVGTH